MDRTWRQVAEWALGGGERERGNIKIYKKRKKKNSVAATIEYSS